MTVITQFVKLKKLTKTKHKQFLSEQQEYARAVNWCVTELQTRKLTSLHVPHNLKAAIKNEAIRRAKKALVDFKSKRAKRIPAFKSTLPISVNNQNWSVRMKKGKWYIGFTTNKGKLYLPVEETAFVHTYFPYFQDRAFRGTMQLSRKGRTWYVALPVTLASPLKNPPKASVAYTPIGVDLGLRHLAVACEPTSNKRQFFSGKEVGFKRRRFRSLRTSLGQKKALRAVKSLGQKEAMWMTDYNRKLAKDIVSFARQFDHPMIKLEQLEKIRTRSKSTKRADRTIHSWAFYQLKRFIKERAAKYAIPVVDINPYKTSQTCSACGVASKKNRYRDRFRCLACGHRDHADLNAARNIARA